MTVTPGGALLAATIALPVVLAALVPLAPSPRRRALDLLPLAPLPGVLAALFARGEGLAVLPQPMRMVLALDLPGALLLGGASFLWLCAGVYARSYLRDDPGAGRIAVWWLLTLAGTLGVFVVADVASFYLVYALASLPAYGLVAHAASARSARAGYIYLALAMPGEAVLLLAFVLLAAGGAGNPLIREAVAGLPASPDATLILVLLLLGFGLKMGLVPLHVWMPLAHPVAPMPASAVLSGIVVKAGVIGLIRFLPPGTAWPLAGTLLTGLGLATAFYGVLVGLTQTHPKTVLAYSTISQMGLVAAILGSGLATGSAAAATVAAFYALHHLLVKGALFLGVGAVSADRRLAGPAGLAMAVLGLSLAGLPLTGGALAKAAAKAEMGDGPAALLATLAAAGSAALMLHFLGRLHAAALKAGPTRPALGLVLPWAAVAVAAMAAPSFLLAPVTGLAPGSLLVPGALGTALWPVLLGGAIWLLLRWRGRALPAIPEGDVLVLAERVGPLAGRLVDAVLRAETALRRWPAATTLLAVLVLALAAALAA